MAAFRACLNSLGTAAGANAGYVLRYLIGSLERGQEAERNQVFERARRSLEASKPLYTAAYIRWRESLAGSHEVSEYRTKSRLIIGLGRDTVLETGITLQHTYGVPVLPGTGLKGLCAHYCHTVWGAENPAFQEGGELHKTLFGTTESAGWVSFADAWMKPESIATSSGLLRDVITPHHQAWNSGLGKRGENPAHGPSDEDDPIPVTWMSVKGAFTVAYGLDLERLDPQYAKLKDLVGGLLVQALTKWGIGGKTSSGYGRMTPVK